jgi:hypothetical protein
MNQEGNFMTYELSMRPAGFAEEDDEDEGSFPEAPADGEDEDDEPPDDLED